VAVTFVGFVRGINVGNAKRVAMADLRTLVEKLGYGDVHTLLNSGNIVFTGPGGPPAGVATRIEAGLAKGLGVSARVTVLTAGELAAAAADNPLVEIAANPSRLLVAVLANPADRSRLKSLAKQDWAPEALAIGARVAYLWCPDGIIVSRLAKAVGHVLGDAVTMRNWATCTKLVDLSAEKRR
jgi:uncharacterized protein (DUF1697 family)